MLAFGLSVAIVGDAAKRRSACVTQPRPPLRVAPRMGPAPAKQPAEETSGTEPQGPLKGLGALLRALFGNPSPGDEQPSTPDLGNANRGSEAPQTPDTSFLSSSREREPLQDGQNRAQNSAASIRPSGTSSAAVAAPPSPETSTSAPELVKSFAEAEVKSITRPSSAPALVMQPARPPRDPRRVMVVGAAGRVGNAVVEALHTASSRFSIVGVVRPSGDPAPALCSHVVSLDAASDVDAIAKEVIRLGCGAVVWCASAGPKGNLRDLDYAAVRVLSEKLGSGLAPDASTEANLAWLADDNDSIRLVDFSSEAGLEAFRPIDDAVMGGKSASRVRAGAASVDDGAPAVWSGNISLANRGGFVSVRADLEEAKSTGEEVRSTGGVDLSTCAGIAITCRGDGRRYKINLKNNEKPEFVFQATFDTYKNGHWQTVRVPFSDFVPVIRGKLAYSDSGEGLYASKLNTAGIVSIGLVCSKIEAGGMPCPMFKEGEFRLDLARIDAYRYSLPRFVLVSSAAVTRPFWDDRKKSMYKNAADIPIVKLNASIGNILGTKLAGEDALRTSGIPYTVVRPTGLPEDAPSGRGVAVAKGDFFTGRIAVEDVARAIVEMLGSEDATWKTVEVNGEPEKAWSARGFLESLQKLPADDEQILYPDDPQEV